MNLKHLNNISKQLHDGLFQEKEDVIKKIMIFKVACQKVCNTVLPINWGILELKDCCAHLCTTKRRVVARLLPPKFPTVPITLDFVIKKMFTKENYHMSKILPQNKHVRSEKETNKCGEMGKGGYDGGNLGEVVGMEPRWQYGMGAGGAYEHGTHAWKYII